MPGDSSTALRDLFQQLDRLLCRYRRYWQLRPFDCLALPWQEDVELCQQLEQLTAEELHRIEQDDPLRARWLSPFLADAPLIESLARIEPVEASQRPVPARFSYHIPGRKWAQIRAFEAALSHQPLPYLEWCAGKGHLGRLLAHQRGRPVTSLEIDSRLCASGKALTDKTGLDCRFVTLDALGEAAARELQPEQHAVALHACGQLHLHLMEQASRRGTQALSIAPCCYHLINGDHYRPISQAAKQSHLELDKQDLSLPMQELVTGGQRVNRMRRQELRWRLGFDQLQRHIRDADEYLPCPTFPKKLLSGSFEAFCRWMAERKQLILPARFDSKPYERQGAQRAALVDRIELVRHLFRRPLEIWLILDRALYLQEQGYRVTLNTFCAHPITPRNLLIQACRSNGSEGGKDRC